MAVIEEQVYTILSGVSAITSLVPAARIKVPGSWQDLARPYIIHFPVSAAPFHVHDGSLIQPGIWDWYQISVFSNSYSEGRAVCDAIIDNFRGCMTGGVTAFLKHGKFYQGRDSELNVEHFSLNYRIAEGL